MLPIVLRQSRWYFGYGSDCRSSGYPCSSKELGSVELRGSRFTRLPYQSPIVRVPEVVESSEQKKEGFSVSNSTARCMSLRGGYAALDLCLTAVLILAVLCALAQPAYAYVDPGSGLFALQIVSSTFAGMIFLLRKRLRSVFGKVAIRFGLKSEDAAKE